MIARLHTCEYEKRQNLVEISSFSVNLTNKWKSNLPFALLNSMVAKPFGAWPKTRNACDEANNGIWLTTICCTVTCPDGINLLSLSTEARAIVLPLINFITLVGGSESIFEENASNLICSLADFPLLFIMVAECWSLFNSIIWERMPFLTVPLLMICKPPPLVETFAAAVDVIVCECCTFKLNGMVAAFETG